jgi:glycosyltransferase involved in cell wall biosynthesis
MASGLPIVVSDLPVLRGVIENRVNGLIVALEDADATAEAINFLIENPEIAQSYASRARGDVQTKFSFVNWEKNLVKIYFQLLELAKS